MLVTILELDIIEILVEQRRDVNRKVALHCFRVDPNLVISIHQLGFWNESVIWQYDFGVKN